MLCSCLLFNKPFIHVSTKATKTVSAQRWGLNDKKQNKTAVPDCFAGKITTKDALKAITEGKKKLQ